ncbi:Synaptotagmin-15 [Nymphon striatum]|nr:Synaptotagmin-15 [Nymphon striatum]
MVEASIDSSDEDIFQNYAGMTQFHSSSSSSSSNEESGNYVVSTPTGNFFLSSYSGAPNQSKDLPEDLESSLKRSWAYNSFSPVHNTNSGGTYPRMNKSSDEDDQNEPPCSHGRVWLSLSYEPEKSRLYLNVKRARYLPGRGMNCSTRNVFFRVYLLPDEVNYLQSKTKKRTLSPKFNDTFLFTVNESDLQTKTLRISFYDVDKRKVRHSLGHLLLPLKSTDFKLCSDFYKDLEIQQRMAVLGEIQVKLYCNPMADRLRITISHLSNIQEIKFGETGVSIRVQLFHGKRIMKTKRTAVMKMMNTYLYLDESYTFAVAGRHIDNCSLCVTVMFYDSSNSVSGYPYGRVILGSFMYARGEQLSHWQGMMSNPRTSVTKYHRLEPCLPDENPA